MRNGIWAFTVLAVLGGCGVAPIATGDRQPRARLDLMMVAAGLNGDCPKSFTTCEVFLTIVDNPDTSPNQGGPGRCEVAIPVTAIQLHSTPQRKQVVRWKILNSGDFGFAASAILISPNQVPSGDAAFEDARFTVNGKDDQYQWSSTGRQTGNIDNGYVAHVVRKNGNLACGTKDPLIVNLP